MSRFYLTLPSNSSTDYYPQNIVDQNRVKTTINQNLSVEFSSVLARLLEFRRGVTYSDSSLLAETKMRLRSLVRPIYLYCGFAEHVPVGDTQTPLLRSVNRTSNGNENVHETFKRVLYVPLQCTEMFRKGRNYNLMTDSGVPVPFLF